jgi:uncharacterized protein YhaN
MPPKRAKTAMTAAHKRALAEGRQIGRAVRNYLEALDENRPRRGRKRTPESIKRQLDGVGKKLAGAAPLQRLQLLQQRMDLEAERARLRQQRDMAALEREFTKVGLEYATRKGISYAAWRAMGVPAEVLKRAGITRSS